GGGGEGGRGGGGRLRAGGRWHQGDARAPRWGEGCRRSRRPEAAHQALGLGEHPGLVPGVGVLGIAAPDPRRREGALSPCITERARSYGSDGVEVARAL